ncbi:DUF397 domain-containing protein [Streptomyces sp. MNU76]|uniref:DUF397 domain-containing protein n=1 Tax=Streptomyces sp. MNU76 TaxID=2560026 RepID=UPI001E611B5B|nr:DUF397 domain-containing protein [Streptomyces sp. MNU76]MCC9710144.1 DUF397 domain-containing protein [Streptomyces sp. MNU76]
MNHAPRWQRSSFSGGGEGNTCIELAAISTHLLGLRESDTPATHLHTAPTPRRAPPPHKGRRVSYDK